VSTYIPYLGIWADASPPILLIPAYSLIASADRPLSHSTCGLLVRSDRPPFITTAKQGIAQSKQCNRPIPHRQQNHDSVSTGLLPPEMRSQIQSLSLTQLESLGEALPDFTQPADLLKWPRSQSIPAGKSKPRFSNAIALLERG
jgi:Domain of unknown function (DUF4351)